MTQQPMSGNPQQQMVMTVGQPGMGQPGSMGQPGMGQPTGMGQPGMGQPGGMGQAGGMPMPQPSQPGMMPGFVPGGAPGGASTGPLSLPGSTVPAQSPLEIFVGPMATDGSGPQSGAVQQEPRQQQQRTIWSGTYFIMYLFGFCVICLFFHNHSILVYFWCCGHQCQVKMICFQNWLSRHSSHKIEMKGGRVAE